MTPLAALIAECKQLFLDAHGVELTNGDIARRSGGRLTRQRVQQYATGDRSMPTPETVKGFSLGLQVPSSVVLQRALETAGYTRGAETDAAAMTDPEAAATIEALKDELRRRPARRKP